MKMLINSSILNKFKDTISEDDYKNGWDKLQSYQAEATLIKDKSETTFQSEFLSKIFDNILGYKSSSNHSLKETNLLVEHKNPNSGEKTDGVVVDKYGEVTMVIELKSVKDTKGTDLVTKKRGGSDGKTPLQQAAVYLFQFPKSTLAVVSNFDTVIIFDRKEAYRQEYSLFTMDFDEFKEFYLILSANSFFGGLTMLMIRQSEKEEKSIDDDFFIKIKNLKKILKNTMKDTTADDLFNKFLALAILEDNGTLPTNLINTIHNMKDDFTHTHNHWGVWVEFFKSLKNHKPGKELMGIDPSNSSMEVWQDISYFGKTKIQKSTLDLVVELSKYDLFSIPLQELFFRMAVEIDSPYHTVFSEIEPYKFYSELLKKDNKYGCDQAASFITLKTCNDTYPLIKLFNQVSQNRVMLDTNGDGFAIAPVSDCDDYWTLVNLSDLDDIDTVNLIKQRAISIQLFEPEIQSNYSYVLVYLSFFGFGKNAADDIPLYINYGTDSYPLDRKTIKTKIKLLNTAEQKWLDERMVNCKYFSDFVEITDEENADFRFSFDTQTFATFNKIVGIWEDIYGFDFDYENAKYIYFKATYKDLYYIIKSNEFSRVLDLIDYDETTIINLPIFAELTTEKWLDNAKNYDKLTNEIKLYENKQTKLEASGGHKLELLEIEDLLDKLYEKQRNMKNNV